MITKIDNVFLPELEGSSTEGIIPSSVNLTMNQTVTFGCMGLRSEPLVFC